MIKVLILNDQLTRGGKERRIVELVKYCHQHYNVVFEIVIMHNDVEYKDVYDTGFKVHLMKWGEHGTLGNFKKIIAITKSFQPDIIHSWSSMTDVVGLFLKFYTRKKFISSMIARAVPFRSLKDKEYRRSLYVFPFTDVITANTKAGIASYNAPAKKSICIYNGFNFDRLKNLDKSEILVKQHNLEGKYVVGMVAAFAERKDQETFVTAALSLLKKYPGKIAFILIGYGIYQEDRMKQAGEHLQKDIIFTGICNIVEQYVNIFDVGVLCTNSDVHGEGISNSILEYMAIGKPAIATEGGGTNEIVVDNETGFLIKPKNPQALEEKIIYLMEHPAEAKAMGEKGHQRIKENFSIEAMCSSFMSIYEKLSKKKGQHNIAGSKKPEQLAQI
ncbi:MAG: glycosyltransferase family 4 protein [Ferruginibacter sp.]